MKVRLRYRPRANADVEEIAKYLTQYSRRVAERFIEIFIDVTSELRRFPLRGPLEEKDVHGTLRRVVMPTFRNYLVFYRFDGQTITVVRVLHSARDLGELISTIE